MYFYIMNSLYICHMLWARDTSNIVEYKPSLKPTGALLRIMCIPGRKYCQLYIRDSNVEGSCLRRSSVKLAVRIK